MCLSKEYFVPTFIPACKVWPKCQESFNNFGWQVIIYRQAFTNMVEFYYEKGGKFVRKK